MEQKQIERNLVNKPTQSFYLDENNNEIEDRKSILTRMSPFEVNKVYKIHCFLLHFYLVLLYYLLKKEFNNGTKTS